jgi:hypothetical protein
MQYLNDDMDELFRRAAKDYPLKLQEEDWNAIAGKLATGNAESPAFEKNKGKRNNYKLLLLALLISIIPVTTVFTVLNKQNKRFENDKAYEQSIGIKPEKNYISDISKSNRKTKNNAVATFNSHKNLSKPTIPEKLQLIKAEKEVLNYSDTRDNKVMDDKQGSNEFVMHNPEQEKRNIKVENNISGFDKSTNGVIQSIIPDLSNKNTNKVKEEVSNTIGKKLKQDVAAKKDKRFYVGILAGPQFNQVKNQGFGKPGFSAGLLTGFLVTNKLAIETGVFISEKKYFSTGEYFSMNKVGASMPAGMKVISLNGKSTVFEIPVKLKYDILKKNKGSLFSTAGVSSYVLTNEGNNYLALVNGSQQKLTGSYSNSEKYFNAALNISAGYEYKIKGTILRIEPYVQLPLKGIGVGSMAVLSTGVHVGVTLPVIK